MDDYRRTIRKIALCVVVIFLVLGAMTVEITRSDLPCGRVEKKYHGKFEQHQSFQIQIDDKYHHVDGKTWKDLNIGDLYCEK